MIKNIAVVLVGLALLGLMYVLIVPRSGTGAPSNGAPVLCTADAKICPDGSAVGRVSPNCEFAQCSNKMAGIQSNQVIFNCAEGKSITATFDDDVVEFYVSDLPVQAGRRSRMFTLKQTSPLDGPEVRFVSDDGMTTLWIKDYYAFLEENGKTTFASCVVSPLEFPDAGTPESENLLPH